jgi:uracil phosphoribosyltransferase
VPILRAGLGMLDGMMRLLPTAEVGFLGMIRNEETLQASTYAERLPDDLSGRQCYVLDPMLATGGTLAAAISFLTDRGADDITAICLLAAPEGCARWSRSSRGVDVPVTVVTAAMDEKLNEQGLHRPRARRRGRPAVRPGALTPAEQASPASC